MGFALLTFALVFPIALAWALIAVRRHVRRERDTVSPVSRQHLELLQGGELNPGLVEATKRRFQAMIERGDEDAIEARMRPGEQYVVQVRALAELGTDAAGRILERQLSRHLSDDRLEQTWYRIDLASGLRQLNRTESLPQLLACADYVAEPAPLGPVFAAETVCFAGFDEYLRQPQSTLGEAALAVLRRTLEGFRICLPPHVVVESRLGEMIETLWDHRPRPVHAGTVRVLHEARRYLRRVPASLAMFDREPAERESFERQMQRIEALDPALEGFLAGAGADLLAQLLKKEASSTRDVLLALTDLRVEAGKVILLLLRKLSFEDPEPAIDLLRWSRDPAVGAWIREVGEKLRERRLARRGFFARRTPQPQLPYLALLRACRGQPSAETELFLVPAVRDHDADVRLAATSSLGWWEPVHDSEVIQALEEARRDPVAEVRRSARAALARLGERSALQWFRQALHGDDPQQQHEAIHFVASEGLTLLWPELDALIESDIREISYHAREAIMVMEEEMDWGLDSSH